MKQTIVSLFILLACTMRLHAQFTQTTAVDLGVKIVDFSYTNTQRTFTNPYGPNSSGVYYRVNLAAEMALTINNHNSEVPLVFVRVLNAAGVEIASSYDAVLALPPAPADFSTKPLLPELHVTLPAGVYYLVSEGVNAVGNITTSISGVTRKITYTGTFSNNFSYADTKNTAEGANFYEGARTNDNFYRFDLTRTMEIALGKYSANNPVVATVGYLLDSSLKLIDTVSFDENENNWQPQPNSSGQSSYRKTLPPGTYYWVTEGATQNGTVKSWIRGTVSSELMQSAPNQDQNYIRTRTFTSADGKEFIDAVQYFDGLGRPVQLVQAGAAPDFSDLVTVQEYDAFGRESRTWLPVPNGRQKGKFFTGNIAEASPNAYGNDPFAYTEPVYEPSPLNRITQQYGPGADWRSNGGHSVKTSYQSNSASNPCAYYYCIPSMGLWKNGNYAANTLFVTQTTDEDGRQFYEFKDKLGQVVLQRQVDGSERYDTYYVYDDFGNLRYVLPPLAADSATQNRQYTPMDSYIANYAYIYTYDARNRCTSKRLPGAQPVEYVYDRADRLIFSQDGEQRLTQSWTFNKYDALGRLILTGVWANSGREQWQLKDSYENQLVTEQCDVTKTLAYTWNTLPGITASMVLQAFYYDDSDRFLNSLPSETKDELSYTELSGYGKRYVNTTSPGVSDKGLLVGTIDRMLNDPTKEIVTAKYYDERGRLVQQKSTNLLRGSEEEYYAYSFTGQVTKTKLTHHAQNQPSFNEYYTYGYDHALRPVFTTHQFGSHLSTLLASMQYDQFGRLSQKTVADGSIPITYEYNIRNWLTKNESPYFTETLYYQDASVPAYNGNISRQEWSGIYHPATQSYTFTYDRLNRLETASYSSASLAERFLSYSENMTYDKMGNIRTLQRSKNWREGPFDDLLLSYSGNHLLSVDDWGDPAEGFLKPNALQPVEYAYNRNGSLVQDVNTGITNIQYNLLNLPTQITFKGGHTTKYAYDASGMKRQVIHTTLEEQVIIQLPKEPAEREVTPKDAVASNSASTLIDRLRPGVADQTVTDYTGNLVYENNNLKFILLPEGYATRTDNDTYTYHYYLKDHLGNNRVVLAASGKNAELIQAQDYYPFGMPYADSYAPEQQPYKFGGKELDEMHGLNRYDQGARFFGGIIPVTTTMDPLAEKYYNVSPYAQWGNNPMKYVDLQGDSLTFIGNNFHEIIMAIYNGLEDGAGVKMKFNNGVLDPSSIEEQAENSSDFFLKDLYEIASNPTMVELSISDKNTYMKDGKKVVENFNKPYDLNTNEEGADYEAFLTSQGMPLGKSINGNLGQTLIPGNKSASGLTSTNKNVQVIVNGKGTLNHRTVGVAHEFSHVLLYLRGLPDSHGQSGVDPFVYSRSSRMSKRLGYDF